MDFLNPGLLGPAATFKRRYARPIERWRDEHATARLRRATGPFILRRLKTDKEIISDLPEKIEMRVDCHLTKEQASLYQAVVDEMLDKAARAEGIERSGIILAALMKLKQVCNHPAHLLKDRSDLAGRSGQLARLEEILTEALAEGDRALCFTQFAEFGHLLRGHLQERLGREVLFLHGGTPKSARDDIFDLGEQFRAALLRLLGIGGSDEVEIDVDRESWQLEMKQVERRAATQQELVVEPLADLPEELREPEDGLERARTEAALAGDSREVSAVGESVHAASAGADRRCAGTITFQRVTTRPPRVPGSR
jgi:hypothetical protein